MADRSVALTTVKGGINRLRTRGSAPNDSLYDLINGYVTAAKTVHVRPGTFRDTALPQNTAGASLTYGLVAFEGTLHVFATEDVTVPDGYTLHIIAHPDATPDEPIDIEEINFAWPFMGYIYASVTFVGGDTFHYWLQTGDEWQPETIYSLGDIVAPSIPNGLAFQAQRLTEPNIAWAPNVNRTDGDIVEPTVYNNYYYTVVDTQGANPRSGETEPEWPTTPGAQVIEDADGSTTAPPAPTEMPDPNAVPAPGTSDRYDNIYSEAFRRVLD